MYLAPLGVVPSPPASVESAFSAYGLPGIVAFLFLLGLIALWRVHSKDDTRMQKQYRAEIDRLAQRGDRLERQLKTLNETMQGETMPSLNNSAQAIQRALEMLDRLQRDERPPR